jgi:glycosyltransferase involved in cell wall biosynthesis
MAFKIIDNIDKPIVNKKPRIVMVSDSPTLHTGMGKVVREVALGLHKTGKYEIIVLGWGYNADPHPFPFTILPASSRDFGRGGFPEAGIASFDQRIMQLQPDIVWALGDAWMLNWIKDSSVRNKFKYIQYMPIDGSPVPQYWCGWLKHIDQLVLYSKYGQKEMELADPTINTKLIYHGVHPDVYYPLSQEVKNNIKKQIVYHTIEGKSLVQKVGLPEDSFIVGTVARNQPRKNFDKIIKSFAIFAKDKPNARLWLHAAIQDAAYNLADLAYMFGVGDKVCFTPGYNLVNGLSDQDLNAVMNIFDVGLQMTQGEGFGIPILDLMSCGIPQVLPDYSSHVEWCKDASILIPLDPIDDFITGIPHPCERAIQKVSLTVDGLNKLYNDKDLRKKLGENGRKVAETMTWNVTIPQWENVIDEVLTRA